MKNINFDMIEEEFVLLIKKDDLKNFNKLIEKYKDQCDISYKKLFDNSLRFNALLIIESLIVKNNLVEYVKSKSDYALRYAAQKNKLEMVKLLQKFGADLHACQEYVLRAAISEKYMELFNYCLQQGADISVNENYAIKEASINGDMEIIEQLLSYGAKSQLVKDFARSKETKTWINKYIKKEKLQEKLEKNLPEKANNKKYNKI